MIVSQCVNMCCVCARYTKLCFHLFIAKVEFCETNVYMYNVASLSLVNVSCTHAEL